jgi:hypothetical protein
VTCCFPVGVAGFEPAASSSRIRPWKAADLWTLPKMQVKALVCVGLEWYSEVAISRSSPGFLQRSIVARGSRCMADWSLRCTLLALANELRESMAGLRLRGSPPTRCAMFLNAASSAVAVCVCPVSVGLLEFPALVDLVILAGMAWVWLAGCEYAAGTRTQDRRIMRPAFIAVSIPPLTCLNITSWGVQPPPFGRVFAMIKLRKCSPRPVRCAWGR